MASTQNQMSLHCENTSLSAWLQVCPSLGDSPETDAQALAQYAQAGEALLASLGPKPSRSHEQTLHAERIHEACRTLRRRFLVLHVDWLYDVLTEGFSIHKRLQELAFEAATRCPGLVPTVEQIGRERKRLQRDKEGYEIDQAAFFHALLRSPKIGIHIIESMLLPTARSLEIIKSFQAVDRLDLGSVLLERRGCAAYLTIKNTYCLNAEDDRLVDDMETAVDLALLDDGVRVCVLRGDVMSHPRYVGRRVFSAGINLKALHAGQISFIDFLLRRELGYINKMARGLLGNEAVEGCDRGRFKKTKEKPWIAAVDSFAIGGGAQILLVMDRVIAADDSYFSLPAAQEGIVPGFSALRLTRFMGNRKTRQIILGGRKIWAHESDAKLLFDEVVKSAELDAAVERNVQELSSPAVVANRHMLNLAEEPLDLFLQYAAEFALIQAERLYSQDVLNKTGPP